MTSGKPDITSRWAAGTSLELARAATRRLLIGDGLDQLDLGRHEGRIDLRGLPATEVGVDELTGWAMSRDLSWDGLDLSGARLGGWRFYGCTLRNCRFDDADCRDWRLWGNRTENCTFRRAALAGAVVGTWENEQRNAWQEVDFSEADFRVDVSRAATYQNCDFSGANLAGVRFEQCALSRCRFAGALHDVLFDGRHIDGRPVAPPLVDCDLTRAHLEFVVFLGYRLDGVLLPDDPDLRRIRRFPCVTEQALRLLPDDPASRMLREQLERRLSVLRVGSHPDDEDLFNRRDYLAIGGPEFASLASETFTRAEAACLEPTENGL